MFALNELDRGSGHSQSRPIRGNLTGKPQWPNKEPRPPAGNAAGSEHRPSLRERMLKVKSKNACAATI